MSITPLSFAQRWLERRGMFDDDADYNGAVGQEVMELVRTMSDKGHSGMSAEWTIQLFHACMTDFNEGVSEEWREYWATPEAQEIVNGTGVPMTAEEIVEAVGRARKAPYPRAELRTLASAAERHLRLNQREKGDSWKDDGVLVLLDAVWDRVARFFEVAKESVLEPTKGVVDKEDVLERAGSVLCFLMFICDNLGVFKEEEEEEAGEETDG